MDPCERPGSGSPLWHGKQCSFPALLPWKGCAFCLCLFGLRLEGWGCRGWRVLGFLLDLVVGGALGWGDERRKARRKARRFVEGAEVGFVACVLGDRSYCRDGVLVHLWAAGSTLHVTPTEFRDLHRSPLPVGRWELVRVRSKSRTDSGLVQYGWQVAECRDGDAVVLVGCSPDSMRYLTAVLNAGGSG